MISTSHLILISKPAVADELDPCQSRDQCSVFTRLERIIQDIRGEDPGGVRGEWRYMPSVETHSRYSSRKMYLVETDNSIRVREECGEMTFRDLAEDSQRVHIPAKKVQTHYHRHTNRSAVDTVGLLDLVS
ncbi:hypothetical protein C8R44DRAFT_732539 [Mycena epipterygia]|nr:hypothetical protein C8R44DRAFT_732539 [Mycena epipterygia]